MNPDVRPPRPRSRDDFEIAIICALVLERNAVEALLEEEYETDGFSYGKAAGDLNAYTTGRLGNQHVVLTYMPSMGIASSAAVAANLCTSFRGIRLAITAGICGGAPKAPDGTEILLGDVIVSMSVIQIDFGRQYPNTFVRKKEIDDTLGRANPEIRAYIGKTSGHLVQERLREKIAIFSAHISATKGFSGFVYPGPENDRLYPADYRHKHRTQNCSTCGHCVEPDDGVCEAALQSSCTALGCESDLVDGRTRLQRALGVSPGRRQMTPAAIQDARKPAIHAGRIASSNTVMKSGMHRDRVVAEEKVLGFEMESAGSWEYVPTIAIKGVCDYADSHKNKQWQAYAAATAAACTKAMLEEWRSVQSPPRDPDEQTHRGSVLITHPMHWTITRSPNTLFVGRNDVIQELDTIVREAIKNPEPKTQCRIVISAMGGQGKSEICLQLAQRVRTLFWGIFWVDVSTKSLAENGFLDIAKRVNPSAQTWEHGRQGLANVQQPWILVLDNADDPVIDYSEYFPPGPSGVVVLTSRNHEFQQYATARHIDLEGLPVADARELLLKAARLQGDGRPNLTADANKVAELLHLHPLALIQAGTYVARGHCTLAEYPEVYARQRKKLLTFRPMQARSRYCDVYTAFEASIETLRSISEVSAHDALELLPMLAVCGPNPIPIELFRVGWKAAHFISKNACNRSDQRRSLTKWHVSRFPLLMQVGGEDWDPFRLMEALQMLKAFGLVSVEESDEVSVDNNLWTMRARRLQAHLQAVILWPMQSIFGGDPASLMVEVLLRIGMMLVVLGDHKHPALMVERLFTHLNLDPSKVNEQWVDIYELKAANLISSGGFDEAIALLTQVVEMKTGTLAKEDPSRLDSMYALASAYKGDVRVMEALTLLEQVVEIELHTRPETDPSRLASMHTLATVYYGAGRAQEALSLLEKVVEISSRSIVAGHPARLYPMHALATLYLLDRQPDKAIPLLEHVVETWRRTLTDEHPARLASMHELGSAYRERGQLNEAVALLEDVVSTYKRTLAPEDPFRLDSMAELGHAYMTNGQFNEALVLLDQVVDVRRRTLAEENPRRLISEMMLVLVLRKLNRRSDALQLFKHVVRIGRTVLDEGDLSVKIDELLKHYM
ncbi:hypothetical protein AYO21_11678 [Fonsecaea monophora]|uniref:Nucleoside phosphorylase domain-containing protein n=1 Tax=Fonsecaea monophora TaxID=254056 RepID=A0A177ET66_9EURO|nr:hypothetical protein AYO21_11678 [Fonsecaea monophora]OAG34179.1 hypothetical protein AYO21_11678 [Fonsecaea monophora]